MAEANLKLAKCTNTQDHTSKSPTPRFQNKFLLAILQKVL